MSIKQDLDGRAMLAASSTLSANANARFRSSSRAVVRGMEERRRERFSKAVDVVVEISGFFNQRMKLFMTDPERS